jgi:hypothetical protein
LARYTGGPRTSLLARTNLSSSPSYNMASWSSAARKAGPPAGGNSMMTSLAQANFSGGGMGRGRGPLDIDNWQQTRTASLRIDNVSGANPFTSGVALAG